MTCTHSKNCFLSDFPRVSAQQALGLFLFWVEHCFLWMNSPSKFGRRFAKGVCTVLS